MKSSPIENRRTATWAVIVAATTALAFGCGLWGFSIEFGSLFQVAGTNVSFLIFAGILRKRGWPRCADYLTSVAQMAVLSAVSIFLTYILASTNLPLQDERLAAFDKTLGVEWTTLVDAFMRHPSLMAILNYAYASFNYQLFLLAPLLFLTRFGDVAARFVLAWALALMATVLIFPFVPALGGFLHFGILPSDVPPVRVHASWLYADLFLAARDGNLRVLDLAKLDGIVTFPSFHAAVAILLCWAVWPVRVVRWPVVAWNALMWVSAVPIGAHYVADVLAGSLTAAFAIRLARERHPSEAPGQRFRLAVVGLRSGGWAGFSQKSRLM